MKTNGYIYILTNPSFPDYVKIGYADDVEKRVNQLNRSECTPYAFRIYATYKVDNRLTDLKLHSMIDKLNPELRSRDEIDGKKRVREFYSLSAEDAYSLFEAMAEIHGTTDNLKLYKISKIDKEQEEVAKKIAQQHRSKFKFSELGIPVGAELQYIYDETIKVHVIDDRHISYKDEEYSLSGLAKILSNSNRGVQGTLYFSYNGEILTNLRYRLEQEE